MGAVEHGQILGRTVEIDASEVVAVQRDDVAPASAEPFGIGLDIGGDRDGSRGVEPVERLGEPSPVTSSRMTFGSNREEATSSNSPMSRFSASQKAVDAAPTAKTTSAAGGDGAVPQVRSS